MMVASGVRCVSSPLPPFHRQNQLRPFPQCLTCSGWVQAVAGAGLQA